jgi:hypothetical protein
MERKNQAPPLERFGGLSAGGGSELDAPAVPEGPAPEPCPPSAAGAGALPPACSLCFIMQSFSLTIDFMRSQSAIVNVITNWSCSSGRLVDCTGAGRCRFASTACKSSRRGCIHEQDEDEE